MTIPPKNNPFQGMLPDEVAVYLNQQVERIRQHPMYQQSPATPGLLTPIQQLEWFELLVREETVRLLQDSLREFWKDDRDTVLQLPLRAVADQNWNTVLARLPGRLAHYCYYPSVEWHGFDYHEGSEGIDAVETIIQNFLKEWCEELFPTPKISTRSKESRPTVSRKGQELYRNLGHENIATYTNRQLWKANKFRLGLPREGYDAFRALLNRIRHSHNLPSSKSIGEGNKKTDQSGIPDRPRK